MPSWRAKANVLNNLGVEPKELRVPRMQEYSLLPAPCATGQSACRRARGPQYSLRKGKRKARDARIATGNSDVLQTTVFPGADVRRRYEQQNVARAQIGLRRNVALALSSLRELAPQPHSP